MLMPRMSALGGKADIPDAALVQKFVVGTGTFGQTGTLGDPIHRPLPARSTLSWPSAWPRCLGDLGRDVLLEIMLGHRKLYGLTRTRQRFRCLEVGNRLSRNIAALVGICHRAKDRRCDQSRPSACKLCSHAHALRWPPHAGVASACPWPFGLSPTIENVISGFGHLHCPGQICTLS